MTYRGACQPAGPAAWPPARRRAYRGGSDGAGPSYDAEAADYFARAGITDATIKAAVNEFVAGIKSDFGIASLSDAFDQILLLANQSESAALTNMVSSSFAAINHGAAFAANSGFTGDGTAAYIDTGFAGDVSTNYQQDDAHFSVYTLAEVMENKAILGVTQAAYTPRVVLYPNVSGSKGYFNLNDNSTALPDILGGSSNFYVGDRLGPSARELYQNGTSIFSDAQASNARPSLNFYVLADNTEGVGAASLSNSGAAFLSFGKSLSSNRGAFEARVAFLKSAIGW